MDKESKLRRADSFKSPAIFNLNIPNFDNFCKNGTEKAFSDLAYIRELPWQIFAAAENTDPKKGVTKSDAISEIPTPRSLIVYLQCNGQMDDQEFHIGKRAPAYASVPNTLFPEKTVNKKFSCNINEEEYWAKIDLGSVEYFSYPLQEGALCFFGCEAALFVENIRKHNLKNAQFKKFTKNEKKS